jgi:hypothetical protein
MTHRSPLLATALAVLALIAPATGAWAKSDKDKNKTPATTAAAPAADKPYADWKKTIKDAEVKKGWFTVYKKRENVYLELRPDQLDQPVLGIFSFARGIGTNGLLGGLPLDDILMTFHRSGDHVLVIQKNTRITAPKGTPMEKAVDLSVGESVLASLKIESEQDSTHALLVDFANFVVSDVSDLGEVMRYSLGNKSVRFDKDRSAVTSVKVFPENFEIEALLTYTPNDRQGLNLETVPDERYIPMSVHYSFSKLPDQPMTPRLADDRVGYFLTVWKDFGRDQNENFFVRYVNRWRLEKQDPTAAVSEVKKPIVYYIDKTVPVEYRPYVKKGIENWQKAFEAAGLKNAIIAKDAPDDSTFDPEDVRYSTIRWITSSVPSFGAIGPSRIDPRTGEILDADILFEASFLQGFRNTYRRWSGPDAMAQAIFPNLDAAPSWLPLEKRCDAGIGVMDGGALMNLALHVDGTLPPGEPVPTEWIGNCLTWAVMHEVGHTLGLRHNFRSSTSTPMDKLEDAAWTKQNGLYSSVMDYPTPNVSPDKTRQGEFFTSTAGTEDIWAIRYAYTPSGNADPQQDYAFAAKIADESVQAGHEYSTDEDTYPADALDPRTNIYDLGDDPLAFAKLRTAYLARLWKDPKFEERIVGANGELSTLRRAMDNLLVQYGIALGHAVKYVGGQYVSRGHRGQPGAGDPLTLVPAAKQREALDFLSQRAFAADAFALSPQLLERLGPDRWSHWGLPSTFGPNRLDYDLGGKAFAIQNTLLGRLLDPNLLARLRESESRGPDTFRMSELFDRLTKSLWSEVGEGAAGLKALEGPSTRRQVQRAYVDKLSNLVTSPAPGAPDDARALARLQLTRIDARCARALAGQAPMGDYTRAHLLETRARIKRTLEANRQIETSSGPGANAISGTPTGDRP